jgi:hypothetical protein
MMVPLVGLCKGQGVGTGVANGVGLGQVNPDGPNACRAGIRLTPVDADTDGREHCGGQRPDTHQDVLVRFPAANSVLSDVGAHHNLVGIIGNGIFTYDVEARCGPVRSVASGKTNSRVQMLPAATRCPSMFATVVSGMVTIWVIRKVAPM